jgi:RNA recognition motif-containing protein
MGKKLYVGNLAYSVNEDSLKQLFGKCGSVESARVITDRDSGRSKGFAFVEMSTDDEAANAIRDLGGQDLEGRQINVSEAKPQEPRSGGGGDSRRGGGGGFRSRY